MISITDTPTGQFILACWALFLLTWLITAFFTKRTVENEGLATNGLLIRMAIGIGIVLVLSQHFTLLLMRLWSYSTSAGVIADIAAACGIALLFWARATLAGNWSAGVVLKEGHELVQRGPYALIRHPIYSGLLLLFFGEALWYANVAWFLLTVVVFVSFYTKARREEVFMARHFPTEYPSYKARTTMLIPFVF